MKQYSLLFGLLFFAAVASAALIGGWQPIENVNDVSVVEIGQFAVNEYNKKSNAHLKFVSVAKGEQQVVAGMNYRLILAVKDGKTAKKYKAVVFEGVGGKSKSLTSFEPV